MRSYATLFSVRRLWFAEVPQGAVSWTMSALVSPSELGDETAAGSTLRLQESGLPPALWIVSVRTTLSPEKRSSLKDVGETSMSGGSTPSPLRGSCSKGWSGSLLARVRVPVNAATEDGENVTFRDVAERAGTVSELTAGTNAPSSLVIDETTSSWLPRLRTLRVSVRLVPA